MSSICYRSISDIKQTLENAGRNKRGCTLLIGAGCSLSAGIPTAAGLVEEIKDRYPNHYQRALDKTYPQCMAELYVNERHDLIADYVDKAKINWAHLCIARLMQEGYVDRVLTTNFDLLVVRACALLGVFPAVYDCAASHLLKTADIPKQAVFYLHGQRTGFVLMNTEIEMQENSDRLAPVFEDAGHGRVWIVVGYSGENDPVFKHLAVIPKFDNGLFWIGFGDNEPATHVCDKLLSQNKDAFFTKGEDADSFFIKLTQALGKFPPDLLAKPFSYLSKTINSIIPYNLGPCEDREKDWTRETNQLIDCAIERYEKPTSLFIEDGNPQSNTDSVFLILAIRHLFMQGQYEQILAHHKNHEGLLSKELANLFSMAYRKYGNQLLDKAKSKEGCDADLIFALAEENYKAALAVNPERHEALHNWGNLLQDKAKRKKGKDAEQLYNEAEDKYKQALGFKPKQPDILINYGNLLLDMAKTKVEAKDWEGADQFFYKAEEKYMEADSIKPNMPDVLYNWGNLLLDRAKARSQTGNIPDQLFQAAEKKYEQALAIRRNMCDALYQWGNVFLDEAKWNTEMGRVSEASQFFQKAMDKYKQALAVNPNMWDALNNWGNLLLDQAKTKTGSEADQLFIQAEEKYRDAYSISNGSYGILDNWGNALSDRARRKTEKDEEQDADRLFTEADKKYADALAIKRDASDVIRNRQNLYRDWAKIKTGEEAVILLAKSEEKYWPG